MFESIYCIKACRTHKTHTIIVKTLCVYCNVRYKRTIKNDSQNVAAVFCKYFGIRLCRYSILSSHILFSSRRLSKQSFDLMNYNITYLHTSYYQLPQTCSAQFTENYTYNLVAEDDVMK